MLQTTRYRIMFGQIRAWNPFNGWIPVLFDNMVLQKKVSQHYNYQGIPELEKMMDMPEVKGGIHVPLPDGYSKYTGFSTKYKLELSINQLDSIIETVKNIILDWLLKLEEDGIMGENLSFSNEEKETAIKNNYTVNNFYGNLTNSQIQQNAINSSQEISLDMEKLREIVQLLRENISNINTSDDRELLKAIDNIDTEIKKDKPQVNFIKESLKTIHALLVGIAGSLIASGILYKINQLLP